MQRHIVLMLIAVSASVGCTVGRGDESDGDLGVAALPQIPPVTFDLVQAGSTVASAWKGTLAGGTTTEFWVSKPAYSASAARTFTPTGARSCASFRRSVCGSSWSGATYYQSTYAQSTLDCAHPPTTITPPTGAVSFLASGSYDTATTGSMPVPYAWTYVTGNVEYWAMNQLVSSSTSSTQGPLSAGYTGFTNFISQVCAMSSPPSIWFSAYYVPVSDFCSHDPC